MKWFLLAVAALHAMFMIFEMVPWRLPTLLSIASGKLPKVHELPEGRAWTKDQLPVVAAIVHNAGIYNAILAGGLVWAALNGDGARDVARVLLAGAAVAGIFGTATLRSAVTALQALVGIIGFVLV